MGIFNNEDKELRKALYGMGILYDEDSLISSARTDRLFKNWEEKEDTLNVKIARLERDMSELISYMKLEFKDEGRKLVKIKKAK